MDGSTSGRTSESFSSFSANPGSVVDVFESELEGVSADVRGDQEDRLGGALRGWSGGGAWL